MNERVDVAIVGGGIAGSALGTKLARGGLEVLILERERRYRDKVRGEIFVPWGVQELQRLGLLEVLHAAGGSFGRRFVPYDELFEPAVAEEVAIPLDELIPGVPGSLNVGHPEACEALAQAAAGAGATLRRGVTKVEVVPGSAPRVRYLEGGEHREVSARVVIGADGRNSTVRRQIGAKIEASEPRTMAAGMLVKDLEGWPEEIELAGSEGDYYLIGFPRPGGLGRFYLLWDIHDTKHRFAGPGRQERFLEAFRTPCLPYGDAVADATPAGPCASYPMNDTWIDEPFTEGVVLIGDAAGWNDPILGNGVSIATRDTRLVSEILLGEGDWSSQAFRPYAEERRERMFRLRTCAALSTDIRLNLDGNAPARRRAFFAQASSDPLVGAPLLCSLFGPDRAPAEAFSAENVERIRNFGGVAG